MLFIGVVQSPSSAVNVPFSTLNALAIAPPNQIQVELPATSAAGVTVIDNVTGQEIIGKNSAVKMPMASITKLMTALIIEENHKLDEVVMVPQIATQIPGQKAYLKAYDQFTVGDLLSATLINSANDAAVTLAIYHSGSVEDFVTAMNARALTLGLNSTSYANPTGLDHPLQFSSPKDIAALHRYVEQHTNLKERMSTRGDTIVSLRGNSINLYHTHSLMHRNGGHVANFTVESGKTGTTLNAQQCLVSTVSGANGRYTIVLLQSGQRYKDLETILQSLTALQPSVALHTPTQ